MHVGSEKGSKHQRESKKRRTAALAVPFFCVCVGACVQKEETLHFKRMIVVFIFPFYFALDFLSLCFGRSSGGVACHAQFGDFIQRESLEV